MGNTISFRKEFGLIVIGALIFTASFLWKDLLSDFQQYYFPSYYGMAGRTIYTVLISVLLILVAVNLRSMFGLTNGRPMANPGGASINFDDSPIEDGNGGSVSIDGVGDIVGQGTN